MKSVLNSTWSTISPSVSALRGLLLGVAAATSLAACSNFTSKYEHADVIDKQVHRGSEALDFDDASEMLVSGGWEGELALWPMPQGEPSVIWQGHQGPVHGLGFAEEWIVSAGRDGWIKVWNRHGELRAEKDSAVAVERAVVSSNWVLSGHRDGSVRVWSLPDLDLKAEIALHDGDVRAVAIHAASARFASVGRDRQIFLWDEHTQPRRFTMPPGMVRSLEFSADGTILYGGGWVNLFKWQVGDGQLAVLPTDHWGLISGIQYVPSLNVLATISRINDSSVYFLEPATGVTLKTFTPQRLCGGAITMSPDGRYLATTGDDGEVRMWDLQTEGIAPPLVAAAARAELGAERKNPASN